MSCRFFICTLLIIAAQGQSEAGRFDLYYDIKDESRGAKAIVTNDEGKVLQERILKFGLNSFEDVPVFPFDNKDTSKPLKSSVIFVEFQNVSKTIDAITYGIEEGSLGTLDGHVIFFDPPHLLEYLH